MATDTVRGTLSFEMGGPGVEIFFKNSDLRVLQRAIQDGMEEGSRDAWVQRLIALCSDSDIPTLDIMLLHGAKKEGKPAAIDLDAIDKPLTEIFTVVVDGFCIGMFGRTFEEQQEFTRREIERLQAEADDNPPDPAP